jgi:3-oxoacyl-[acyl-carrier protein] reductase
MYKNIVIVGASRGIGKELVRILAQNENHRIFALARSAENLSEFNALKNVRFHSFDLNSSDVREAAHEIFHEIEHIDVLINNAGKLVNKPFLTLNKSDLLESYQVNVIGVMETVQAAVPKMLETGGHIVNISSMGGFQGTVKFAGLSAYSTSKAAVASFTELFAEEYKDTKIKTNCLCLGSVQTEMLEEAFPGFQAPLSAEEMAKYIANFALEAHNWMHGRIIPVSLTTP